MPSTYSTTNWPPGHLWNIWSTSCSSYQSPFVRISSTSCKAITFLLNTPSYSSTGPATGSPPRCCVWASPTHFILKRVSSCTSITIDGYGIMSLFGERIAYVAMSMELNIFYWKCWRRWRYWDEKSVGHLVLAWVFRWLWFGFWFLVTEWWSITWDAGSIFWVGWVMRWASMCVMGRC